MATTYPIHRSFPKRNKPKNLPEILEVGTVFFVQSMYGSCWWSLVKLWRGSFLVEFWIVKMRVSFVFFLATGIFWYCSWDCSGKNASRSQKQDLLVLARKAMTYLVKLYMTPGDKTRCIIDVYRETPFLYRAFGWVKHANLYTKYFHGWSTYLLP